MISKLLIFSLATLVILILLKWLVGRLKYFYQQYLIKTVEDEDILIYFWAAVGVISCYSLLNFGVYKIILIVGDQISY
ncbi:hypothetical protein [Gloeothece verrucosa]|uniref:Vacuole membrane protein n=1 Tax=Gloeothece verrucosa (strain PCC 7822) TaxID=497965 RepID=E0UNQ7_GLOV7|nr:hypothetical protein [Gloeothece verrucosa]ADN18587.1 vacuole membrane protein [Gloeothece verrucosa PCC 7822]